MEKRTCAGCDAEIVAGPRERNPKKWCSEACRIRTYYERRPDKAEARRVAALSTACTIYVEPCDECGELKTWRYRRRASRICSRDCENVRKARRARDAYRADPSGKKAKVYAARAALARQCECGARTSRPDARMCGQCSARKAAMSRPVVRRSRRRVWRRWAELAAQATTLRLPPGPSRRTRLRKVAAARVVPDIGTLYAGRCRSCSEPFVSTVAHACYCSPRCKPWPGAWIEPGRRFAIYERDGWVCQLCMAPVPRTARHPDPLSPSLDHVTPRSVRPGDHSDGNLRLAHLWCNSVRGDETNVDWRSLIPTS